MAEMTDDAAKGLLILSGVFGTGIGMITHNIGWGLIAFCVFPLVVLTIEKVIRREPL